jgi:hypothetical protein
MDDKKRRLQFRASAAANLAKQQLSATQAHHPGGRSANPAKDHSFSCPIVVRQA